MRKPVARSRGAIQGIPEEPEPFFRLDPADPGKARGFAVKRGEIGRRLDCAYHEPSYRSVLETLNKGQFRVVTFGEIISPETGIRYGTGTPPPIVEKGPDTVPFVRATDIKDGAIQEDGLLFIEIEQPADMKKCLLSAGELIVVRSGVNTGDCAVVPRHLEGSYAAYDLIVRLSGEVLPEFASIFFDTALGRAQLNVRKGRAAQPHLNAEELSSLLVPLPPLPVQREMVAEMEAARESRRRKLEQADALFSGLDNLILRQLRIDAPEEYPGLSYAVRLGNCVTKRLDPYFHRPDFYFLTEALKEKTFRPLSAITTTIVSGRRPAGGVGQINDGIISFGGEHVAENGEIRSGNLRFVPEPFHLANLASATRVNDILLVKDGATTGKVGLLSNPAHANQNINEHVFLIRAQTQVNPVYLFAVMRSSIVQRQIQRNVTGSAQMGITRDVVCSLRIPVPPASIQSEIAAEVSRLRAHAQRLREQAAEEWDAAKARFEARLLGVE